VIAPSHRRRGGLDPWDVPLRRWQSDAVRGWARVRPDNALWVATPGAGKTTAAARLSHALLSSQEIAQVIVVVPKDHLKAQFAISFGQSGIHLEHRFSSGCPVLSADMHGAVVSYQQVAAEPDMFRHLVAQSALVVLDEIHHAGDGARWGIALERAFGQARYRLALSGTPFRTDGRPIPFVTYERGTCVADYRYDYADALREGVCRPLIFGIGRGEATWISKDGKNMTASFEAALSQEHQSERLRTVLLDEGFAEMIRQAHGTLLRTRQDGHPDAGGLLVAVNQHHARQMVRLVRDTIGIQPTIVVSADVDASNKLAEFSRSQKPWIVAVHMVSEGIDIPRLRVGVYGTNVRTEMYFRQFCGRFVRAQRHLGSRQQAYVYVPGDPTLVRFAKEIKAEVLAVLRERPVGEQLERRRSSETEENAFMPLGSSIAVDRTLHGDLPAPTLVPLSPVPPPPPPPESFRGDDKQRLRKQIQGLAFKVSRQFRVEMPKIHGTLNKRFGGPVARATLEQLEHRKRELERWLRAKRYDGIT
jgi:superfamily II DNA or RNA helicase